MSPEQIESPKISVIISTYNAEEWLKKVLWGFNCQIFKDFEVVVADDGSGPKTKQLLEELSDKVFYKIVHVWQEDDGFQKSRILNKAVEACSADYIIMTDGDCIPREDFVEVHYINKEPGYFISGGYYMLPMNISKMITLEDIEEQNCFDINWLKAKGIPKTFKNNGTGTLILHSGILLRSLGKLMSCKEDQCRTQQCLPCDNRKSTAKAITITVETGWHSSS